MTPPGPPAIAAWQKLAALGVCAAVCAILVGFRHRLGADFWPFDASRIGPNLIASAITWAVVFVLAVLLWPPTRRRLHRFMDAKLQRLHATADRAAEHNEWAARQIARMHLQITGQPADRHPHHPDIGETP